MKIYGLWCGGENYGAPDPEKDIEVFDSLKAAKETLLEREFQDGWFELVRYYPKGQVTERLPYVSGSSMTLYGTPDVTRVTLPTGMLTVGPRGGITCERYDK